MWAAELGEMRQVYEPVRREAALGRLTSTSLGQKGNRRRFQRFVAEGAAELLHKGPTGNYLNGTLKDVSELGCLVTVQIRVLPGTDLKLVLNIANYDMSFKGQVRHAALDFGLGIEFREIRKGDRATLQDLLRQLADGERRRQAAGKAGRHGALI